MTVFSSSLLALSLLPVVAYAAYGALLWSMGGRGRDEARQVWLRSAVAALTVAFALLASVWVGYAVGLYLQASNSTAVCLEPLRSAAPDLNLAGYASAVNKALSCADGVLKAKFSELKGTYTQVFEVAAATGLFPLTSAYSMGLFQVSMPFSGAASSALTAIAVAEAAVAIARGFVLLMGLGAVLLAAERLEALGALILAAGMVYPAALAGLADQLSRFSFGWSPLDWGGLVDLTAEAARAAAYTALALSLATAGVAAVAYALSKVPQHISVE